MLFSRASFDVVIIAASRGGLDVLQPLLSALPCDFPVPILVVRHSSSTTRPNVLPELLARRTRLRVKQAEARETVQAQTVYVGPPARHLRLADDGALELEASPAVNYVRPSADVLLRSAARAFGHRTLGVILSGALEDGAGGAVAVMRAGGVMLAQEPHTCVAPGMPSAAIARSAVRFVLPPRALPAAILSLVEAPGMRGMLGLAHRDVA